MTESKISIVVPIGHINPQKKRPKISVPTIIRIDKRAAVTTVRFAILMTTRINGSKRKKMF